MDYETKFISHMIYSKDPDSTPGYSSVYQNIPLAQEFTVPHSITRDDIFISYFVSFSGPPTETSTSSIGFSRFRRHGWATGRFCAKDNQFSEILDSVDVWANHLAPALSLAYSSGYEDLKVLTTNNIENLKQFQWDLGLIDVARLAALVFKDAKAADPFGAFQHTLKLLANAHLLYTYGLSPTRKDAKEFVARHKEVIRVLRETVRVQVAQPFTLYGEHYARLPKTSIFGEEFQLRAHVKVKGRFGPHTLLSFLAQLDSIGLGLTSANWWDLQPGSFLFDWFTNTGNKLKVGDAVVSSLLYNLSPVVCSLRSDIDIPSNKLPAGSVITKKASARYYRRFVLNGVPAFVNTAYDFLPPPGPNYLIGASLLIANI